MRSEEFVNDVIRDMLDFLDNSQLVRLRTVLNKHITAALEGFSVEEKSNHELVRLFVAAKQVEGCSRKTLRYYETTLEKMCSLIETHVTKLTTNDLRDYLADYRVRSRCSLANIDNIRRILSSFFMWLENENYILKSPVRRIHKVRSPQMVKDTSSDDVLEELRYNAKSLRDLAINDLLASTGMRIGELVGLNRDDVDFEKRECIVFGKGSKERVAYFDARTKLHLTEYLKSRKDDNPALFVSLLKPYKRLEISGVEIRLRRLGRALGCTRVHPHKFRRTLATRAIDKGMPIEQVQRLLGHNQIDTTMHYAMVSQNNVKLSHQKYLS